MSLDWAQRPPHPDPEFHSPVCPLCGCDFTFTTHVDVGCGMGCQLCWTFEPDGPLMAAHRYIEREKQEMESECGPPGLRSPTVKAIVFGELRRIQND